MRKRNIITIALGEVVKIFDTIFGVIIGGLTTAYLVGAGDFKGIIGTEKGTTFLVLVFLYLLLKITFSILEKFEKELEEADAKVEKPSKKKLRFIERSKNRKFLKFKQGRTK